MDDRLPVESLTGIAWNTHAAGARKAGYSAGAAVSSCVLGHGPLSLRTRPSPWTAGVVAAGRDRRDPLGACPRWQRIGRMRPRSPRYARSPTTSYRRRVEGRHPPCSCGGFSGRFAGSGFSSTGGPRRRGTWHGARASCSTASSRSMSGYRTTEDRAIEGAGACPGAAHWRVPARPPYDSRSLSGGAKESCESVATEDDGRHRQKRAGVGSAVLPECMRRG